MSGNKNVGWIIAAVVACIIAVAAAIGLLYYYVWRPSAGSEPSVTYKETEYAENTSIGKIELGANEFTVNNVTQKYTVGITPNAENNFYFNAAGKMYKLTSVDCGKLFTVASTETGFTVTPNGDLSSMLRKNYGVDLKYNSLLSSEVDYFILTVKADKAAIALSFGIELGELEYSEAVDPTITLTPDNIVF